MRSSLDPDSSVYGASLTDLPEHGQQKEPRQGSKRFNVLRSSQYSLLAADLRSLHPDTVAADRIDVEHLLGSDSTGLRSELPTLILFECVLAYIAPEKADLLIQLLGQRYADIRAVSYDIALAGDDNKGAAVSAALPSTPPSRFGRVMLQNLEVSMLAPMDLSSQLSCIDTDVISFWSVAIPFIRCENSHCREQKRTQPSTHNANASHKHGHRHPVAKRQRLKYRAEACSRSGHLSMLVKSPGRRRSSL